MLLSADEHPPVGIGQPPLRLTVPAENSRSRRNAVPATLGRSPDGEKMNAQSPGISASPALANDCLAALYATFIASGLFSPRLDWHRDPQAPDAIRWLSGDNPVPATATWLRPIAPRGCSRSMHPIRPRPRRGSATRCSRADAILVSFAQLHARYATSKSDRCRSGCSIPAGISSFALSTLRCWRHAAMLTVGANKPSSMGPGSLYRAAHAFGALRLYVEIAIKVRIC